MPKFTLDPDDDRQMRKMRFAISDPGAFVARDHANNESVVDWIHRSLLEAFDPSPKLLILGGDGFEIEAFAELHSLGFMGRHFYAATPTTGGIDTVRAIEGPIRVTVLTGFWEGGTDEDTAELICALNDHTSGLGSAVRDAEIEAVTFIEPPAEDEDDDDSHGTVVLTDERKED